MTKHVRRKIAAGLTWDCAVWHCIPDVNARKNWKKSVTHCGSPFVLKATEQCLTYLSRGVGFFPKAPGDFLSCVALSLSFCPPSGLCAITGVSVFANMLVTNFWMSTTSMFQGMQNVQNRWVLRWLCVPHCGNLPQGCCLRIGKLWGYVGVVAGLGRLFLGDRASSLGWR